MLQTIKAIEIENGTERCRSILDREELDAELMCDNADEFIRTCDSAYLEGLAQIGGNDDIKYIVSYYADDEAEQNNKPLASFSFWASDIV